MSSERDKGCFHMHPAFNEDGCERWLVVRYNGNGQWAAGSVHPTKSDAKEKMTKWRRRWREQDRREARRRAARGDA